MHDSKLAETAKLSHYLYPNKYVKVTTGDETSLTFFFYAICITNAVGVMI